MKPHIKQFLVVFSQYLFVVGMIFALCYLSVDARSELVSPPDHIEAGSGISLGN